MFWLLWNTLGAQGYGYNWRARAWNLNFTRAAHPSDSSDSRYAYYWCKSGSDPGHSHGYGTTSLNFVCIAQWNLRHRVVPALHSSLKKTCAASFTSSSSAFSSSSSDSSSSLLFLRRRLTGLSASFTWQPLLVLRFLLFPLFLQSSGMSRVSLNIQNWKQNQIKSATILLSIPSVSAPLQESEDAWAENLKRWIEFGRYLSFKSTPKHQHSSHQQSSAVGFLILPFYNSTGN